MLSAAFVRAYAAKHQFWGYINGLSIGAAIYSLIDSVKRRYYVVQRLCCNVIRITRVLEI